MSLYVLGLRRAGAQTDEAMPCRTARAAIRAVEVWVCDGGTVTVILRAGKPITEGMLRHDADRGKRHGPAHHR